MQGLLGRKVGMTRVFDATGRQVPVTVIEAGPCVVVQRKTKERDGYDAWQLGFHAVKESRATKPRLGHCRAAHAGALRHLLEFPAEAADTCKVGDAVTVGVLADAGFVDVTGMSKGRGFQGVVRRHGMSGGPSTHGGHSKRRVGSIGCREFPGRVHKNKRMPGHMGNVRVTQENLQVIQVRGEDNLLLVKGAVPGPTGGLLEVRRSQKRPGPPVDAVAEEKRKQAQQGKRSVKKAAAAGQETKKTEPKAK